jgi:hypothetical protein
MMRFDMHNSSHWHDTRYIMTYGRRIEAVLYFYETGLSSEKQSRRRNLVVQYL